MDKSQMSNSGSRKNLTGWRIGAVALATLIIVGTGLAYGHYSHRWGPPADMASAVSQVDRLPKQLGEWSAIEELTMGETELEMLECAGYCHRRYVQTGTGKTVTVAILLGPPGPIAVHTPEICFSSRAYDIQRRRELTSVASDDSQSHTFWQVEFASRNALAESLQVMYAWSDGERWFASKSPRFEFAALPYLYKLQLSAPVSVGRRDEDIKATHDFLRELASVWNQPLD